LILQNGGYLKKIHSLEVLREDLKELGVSVSAIVADDDIRLLDPYYIGGRYPLAREPDYEDATKAIKIVEKVKRFVEHEAGLEGTKFDKSWWESV
jgi:HEPN domain-containing protein